MKLLQLNLWGGRLEKQVAHLLTEEQADILCLQEAIDLPGGGNGGFFLTVEEIAELTQSSHTFTSPVISFQFMNRTASFGNALISRLPFTSQQTIFTNLNYKEHFDFSSDDYNIRNLQHVVVEVDGQPVHVLTHHGHHVHTHKNGDADTMRQCKQIATYISTLEGPVILTGDFNLAPHSESLEQLNSILTNLAVTYKLPTTRTNLTFKTEVCDYIFVNDLVKVEKFEALDEVVSDHKALLLEFSV